MFVVGLTGGIASGKTTVSDLFSNLGAKVVDADLISRTMLDPGQPGYQSVVNKLGNEILENSGAINRQRLRQQVFNQPELKQWLEQTLHPLIYRASEEALQKQDNGSPYALFVVPLMFETNFHQLAERFCVIDCDADTQLTRLKNRDGVTESLAKTMIGSQLSNEARLDRADDIIRNSGTLESLEQQVERLHQTYLELAADRTR